jgi:hypothetical protein
MSSAITAELARRRSSTCLAFRVPRLSRRVRPLGSKKTFFGHVGDASFARLRQALLIERLLLTVHRTAKIAFGNRRRGGLFALLTRPPVYLPGRAVRFAHEAARPMTF